MNTPIVEHMDFLKWNFPPEFLARYAPGVIFKKSWTVRFTDSEALFFGTRSFSAPGLTPAQVEAAKRVVVGVTLVELATLLPGAEIAEMIGYLDRNGLIRPVYQNDFIDTAWEKQIEYFTDFVDDPNAAQRQLLAASVCIIGCGGGGNIAIQHLVAAGVQEYILIDGDAVEKGNFNRQFCFDNEDLGQAKVAGLKDYILARNPAAIVHTFCQRIESSADLSTLLADNQLQPDVILCCADTPPIAIQTFVLEHCIKHSTICTFMGVGVHHGHFGPLLVETSHMEQCLAHKQQQLNMITALVSGDAGTGVISGSISYLNTTVISLMITDLIELLAGIRSPSSLNRLWRYDAATKSTILMQEY
jgi:molybdopterin/thiamine biosynthesis adenylyltransferase